MSATNSQGRTVSLSNISVSALLLRYLAMENVTTVFGIPGAAVMQLAYQLRTQEDSFRYVICRQETGGAYIADGYARMTDGLAVLIVTSGPGATNALTGAVNADSCGTSMLVLSGEVKEMFFGESYLQEGVDLGLDVNEVYAAAVAYSAMIDNPANAATLFEEALREARAIPHRAVHVSLPLDVSQGVLAPVTTPPTPPITIPAASQNYRPGPPPGCDPATAAEIVGALLAADRPLLMLGNGARVALRGPRLQALQAFLNKYAIPAATSPGAKAIYPESDPMSLRNYGMTPCYWTTQYMGGTGSSPQKFDALLVIGSNLGEFATTTSAPVGLYNQLIEPDGPFIQVDANPSVIGRTFPVDTGVVADAGATIDALLAAAQGQPVPDSAPERLQFIQSVRSTPPSAPPNAPPTPGTVHPIALMQMLNKTLPAGSQIFIDCGNCVGWSMGYLVADPPTAIHSALSMGPMGFAVGAAIGAKLAEPQTPCVAICGDGAFAMHCGEVATAVQYGAHPIWIVLDDSNLAMVSQGMAQFYPALNWSDYYASGVTDIAALATAMGAQAQTVNDPTQLGSAIGTALTNSANAPQLVAVVVDPAAIPPYYVPAPF